MPEATQEKFHAEVNETRDAHDVLTSRVVCHGRLVAGDTETIRSVVYPLIVRGGQIVIDCSDISYVDSMGLGSLVALKVSSVHKGFGTIEFINLSPRIKELLRITKLTEYLSRPDTINLGS